MAHLSCGAAWRATLVHGVQEPQSLCGRHPGRRLVYRQRLSSGEDQECSSAASRSVPLDRLLQSARSGNGGAIVVHGEPGHRQVRVAGPCDGRGDGVPRVCAPWAAKRDGVPFAALHQLCAPTLVSLEQLPAPQTRCARCRIRADRRPRPIAWWWACGAPSAVTTGRRAAGPVRRRRRRSGSDRESAQASHSPPVGWRRNASLSCSELGASPESSTGLAELRVEGLDQPTALTLLRSASPIGWTRPSWTGSSPRPWQPARPLELPRGLTPRSWPAGSPSPVSVPIPARTRRRFPTPDRQTRRNLRCSSSRLRSRRAIRRWLWRARALGDRRVRRGPHSEAEALLELRPRVTVPFTPDSFAVYQSGAPGATAARLTTARRATDGRSIRTPPCTASQATVRPDEDVARELELVGGRAQARGGLAAAAAFMERSAELTRRPKAAGPAGPRRCRGETAGRPPLEARWRSPPSPSADAGRCARAELESVPRPGSLRLRTWQTRLRASFSRLPSSWSSTTSGGRERRISTPITAR